VKIKVHVSLWQLFKWIRSVSHFFLPYIKPDKGYIALMCVFLVVITLANTLMIWLLGNAVSLLTAIDYDQLSKTLLILVGVVFVSQCFQFAYFHIFNAVSLRYIGRVRENLLSHVMALSYPVASLYERGDLIARLSNDIDRLTTFVLDVPLSLLSHLLVLMFYVSMLFWIDWQLALIALLLAPLFYLLQHFLAPRKGQAASKFFNYNGNLLAFETQALSNLRGISSFNAEQEMQSRHAAAFDVARRWSLKMRKIDILYNSVFAMLIYITGIIVAYNGIEGIQSGRLSVGVLISFVVYLGYLSVPVRGVAQIPIQLQGDVGAAERVMAVMNRQSDIIECTPSNELHVTKGEIVIRDLSFSYQENDSPIFYQLSETVRAGETVALVGASGSGKSTLAALIMRFYDPQQGDIEIDGVNIKSVSLASLRRNVSVVWQEPFFINGTIMENLKLANPNASHAQVINACKDSFAWEFIEPLTSGLDTKVGAHGINLSVGQYQRLAIAQAFLRDAPILILDEASSALDSHSEQVLVDALQKLRAKRTTLIIAHRYSSIRSADRVVYLMGDGSAVSGKHEDLYNYNADYKRAVQWQTTVS